MSITQQHYASVYRDLDAGTAARNRAARAELPCSECGSADGMQSGWTRDAVSALQPSRLRNYGSRRLWRTHREAVLNTLFRYQDNDHELYQACWQCNFDSVIPDGFTPLTPEQVAAWLARACTCPDCVRERESAEATWESLRRGIIDWPEPDQTYGAAD